MAKFEVFSIPDCGYCRRAKALLAERGLAYDELKIALDPAHRDGFPHRLPRVRALPQIFINGEHIGGYEDLCLLDGSGRLATLTDG